MVRIRLKRIGRKKRPFYRIVVTDKRNRRDGAALQELGYYNPILKELKLDKQAALEWLAKGASASESAQRLIDKASETGELIKLEVKKQQQLSKKAKAKAEAEEQAKAAAVAAEAAAPPPAEETPAEATAEEAPAPEEAPQEA